MKWTKSRKLLSEHIKNSSKMSQKWCWDIHATRIQSSKNARDLWKPERRQQRVHHWSGCFIVDQTWALTCISLSFLHEYDVKLQISLFMEVVKTPDDDILFLFFFFRKPWALHSRKSFFSLKIHEMELQRWSSKQRELPCWVAYLLPSLSSQGVTNVNFLLTISIGSQEKRLGELINLMIT